MDVLKTPFRSLKPPLKSPRSLSTLDSEPHPDRVCRTSVVFVRALHAETLGHARTHTHTRARTPAYTPIYREPFLVGDREKTSENAGERGADVMSGAKERERDTDRGRGERMGRRETVERGSRTIYVSRPAAGPSSRSSATGGGWDAGWGWGATTMPHPGFWYRSVATKVEIPA